MSITELSIKRPSLIIVVFVVLAVVGIFSFKQLSYELIPKFTAPFIIVTTVYPGASPAEVENSVTKVVEDALSGLENIVSMKSTSFESLSFVNIELKDGTNVDLALADAQRKLDVVLGQFPEQADPPALTKFASDEFPILSLGATATASTTAFYDLVKDRVVPTLASVQGVGEVRLIGGQEREIKVNVNRQAMESRGLTILQVLQSIRSANLDFPTGKIENPNELIIIRLAGKFQSVEDMRELVVANNPQNGSPIKLGEIAEVSDSQKDLKTISRVDGRDAIGIQVLKTTDANAVAVADGVLAKLDLLEKQFPQENLKFYIANNQTDFTREAVDAVEHDLLLAIFLVAAVMLLFLHSIRNAIIVMLAIPTSLVATFIMMYAFNFTLNLMTLLAMSLVIGILVDDSIVVLENIYRHLEQGMKRRKAALVGRNEIAFTALSITLVDIIVFVPIALAGGIVGNIMRQFALVVVFSTLMSLFVSFTLTPMLASRFSRLEKFSNKNLFGLLFNGFEHMLHRINNWYARQIGRILKPLKIPYRAAYVRKMEALEELDGKPRKKHFHFYLNGILVTILTFALFFGSFSLVSNGYIGSAFIQPSDRGEFIMKLELPKDATLKQTNLAAQKAEEFLFKQKEIDKIFTTVGITSGMLGSQNSAYMAELTMKLVPREQRNDVHTDIYAQQVRNELERELAGVKVTTAPVSFFGGADQDPIMFFVSGSNKAEVMKYANEVLEKVKKIKGTLEAELSIEEGNPEIKVSVDRERMAKLGLTMDLVGATMQTAFNGNDDVQFRAGDKEYDINVRMDEFNRNSITDIANLTLQNTKGELIRLSQFADIVQSTGPNQYERTNRQPSVMISSKVLGRPSGEIGADIKTLVEKTMPPPPGIFITYDGDIKNQDEGFGSLGLALMASLLFVYLLLVALYDSWTSPIVVTTSFVGIAGSLLAMALSMSVLDIFSILGIIMMIGLVAKNAILLVDFANQARGEGMNVTEALVEAGRTRLRPILMTTIAMTVGFLPIALAKGAGAEWKNGLAWALIGGLLGSMILTLMVAPVAYLFIDGIRSKFYGFLRYMGWKDEADDFEDAGPSSNGNQAKVMEAGAVDFKY
ncbi:MAG: efflux RND transporter permease subunit [Lewinellaceae bacterium]|nr:efflux RND transporter permease subunit [Saprospiraceae bacterium]MCB9340877.1 efflux RND transporter permease subunit [Lewinellaceae bacterium]